MPSFKTSNFALKPTLESGQFFLYEKCNDDMYDKQYDNQHDGLYDDLYDGQHSNWYYITTSSKVFKVKQEGNTIYYDNIDEQELKQFLGLSVPYEDIIAYLEKDKILKQYIAKYFGLRVMRLDPWMAAVSFICSSASNIPKIKRNLRLMSEKFGKTIMYERKKHFLFPEFGKLGNENELKNCSVGFRARYLNEINQVPESFFQSLYWLPYDEAKELLCQKKGIGSKIADCILLFAYNKWDAFPVDVWIGRALIYHYAKGKKLSTKQLESFAKSRFPNYPGYAQQYLYHGFRMKQLE